MQLHLMSAEKLHKMLGYRTSISSAAVVVMVWIGGPLPCAVEEAPTSWSPTEASWLPELREELLEIYQVAE
jgi:hypothetical protein